MGYLQTFTGAWGTQPMTFRAAHWLSMSSCQLWGWGILPWLGAKTSSQASPLPTGLMSQGNCNIPTRGMDTWTDGGREVHLCWFIHQMYQGAASLGQRKTGMVSIMPHSEMPWGVNNRPDPLGAGPKSPWPQGWDTREQRSGQSRPWKVAGGGTSHESRLQALSTCLIDHQTSFIQHKFQDKIIKNFKMLTTHRALNSKCGALLTPLVAWPWSRPCVCICIYIHIYIHLYLCVYHLVAITESEI